MLSEMKNYIDHNLQQNEERQHHPGQTEETEQKRCTG